MEKLYYIRPNTLIQTLPHTIVPPTIKEVYQAMEEMNYNAAGEDQTFTVYRDLKNSGSSAKITLHQRFVNMRIKKTTGTLGLDNRHHSPTTQKGK